MEDAKLRQALDYFAAAHEALTSRVEDLVAVTERLLDEVSNLRTRLALPALEREKIPGATGPTLTERRTASYASIRGQHPHELKPWEAM